MDMDYQTAELPVFEAIYIPPNRAQPSTVIPKERWY